MATPKKQAAQNHSSRPERGGKTATHAVTREVGSLVARRSGTAFGSAPRSF